MTSSGGSSKQPSAPASRRGSRRREVGQADGTTLVLNRDGSIDLLAADRSVVQSWSGDDPEWATHAFRLGIRVQERTIAPRGPDTGTDKPGS
jgi:hypothetical protein